MPRSTQCSIQIGKQGISENFISTLEGMFKTHENVRVCVLKSAGHDKESVKKMTEDILGKLGDKYTAKIVGFTIFVKKWRRAVSRK